MPGWLSLQQADLDITRAGDWMKVIGGVGKVDAILTEHTLEHLTYNEAAAAVWNFWRYLKPGGHVRVAVPDGLSPHPNYQGWVAPGSRGERWLQQFRAVNEPAHKTLWNFEKLASLFRRFAFRVRLLEWFDYEGLFHREPYRLQDGYIRRRHGSAWSNVLSVVVGAPYTSLILDAVKV